ncbi:TBC1 domain family member 31 [Halyomorpha halys]|uniref:TBC1 domain family member 31 n=1 Tax=Halyomorpha halys TaxID=286706 RepID=UPI0006D510A2|nr:TBC1 domain family member 31 [Halyomorpha halys]
MSKSNSTCNTFDISTEGNEKLPLPNLSEDNLVALVINKCDLRSGKGFSKFKKICVNPRQEQLCSYSADGNCYILDLAEKTFWTLRKERDVSVIEFYPCHDKISLGHFSGKIKTFELASGKLSGTFKGHKEEVKDISFSNAGTQCVSISRDRGFIWDPLTFKKQFLIEPVERSVIKEAKFLPWQDRFLVSTSDNLLSVWDSVNGSLSVKFHALEFFGYYINSFSFNKNGSSMVACGNCNKLICINTFSWSLVKMFVLPPEYTKLNYVEYITQPYDGGESSMVAILTCYHKVVLFHLATGIVSVVGTIDRDCCITLRINTSGKYLFCLMGKGNIQVIHNELWDGRDKKKRREDALKELSHEVQDSYSWHLLVAKKDIHGVISSFRQFPNDVRPFLWRSSLSLPMNVLAHRTLCAKGLHSSFANIKDYPFLQTELRYPVLRLASNLAHWCPMFGSIKYLPLMILRFTKLFRPSPIVAFEVVATILVNYCQNWFNEFPLVPKNVTNFIECILKKIDLELWNYFNESGIQLSSYVWSVMETLFAEVLVEKDWLILWDNVVTSRTDFLTLAVVSFFLINKNIFLSCKTLKEFEFFIHNPVNVSIMLMIEKTRHLMTIWNYRTIFEDFKPLMKGEIYQFFSEAMIRNIDFSSSSESLTDAGNSKGPFIPCPSRSSESESYHSAEEFILSNFKTTTDGVPKIQQSNTSDSIKAVISVCECTEFSSRLRRYK